MESPEEEGEAVLKKLYDGKMTLPKDIREDLDLRDDGFVLIERERVVDKGELLSKLDEENLIPEGSSSDIRSAVDDVYSQEPNRITLSRAKIRKG